MIYNMKSNRGVSMLELVIVMIIMVMIAAFAIFNGSKSIDQAEATELYVEMSNIQKAVNGVMFQRELESGDDNWIVDNGYVETGDTGTNGWYYIYGIGEPAYETSTLRKKLNMDSIKRTYRVNYTTGEVELAKPIEVLGSYVRSYESVRALVESDKI